MHQNFLQLLAEGNGKVKLKTQKLRAYMKAKGWDDAELARRMRAHRSTVSKLFSLDRDPGQKTIARLLEACKEGLDFYDLFFFDETVRERNSDEDRTNTKAS